MSFSGQNGPFAPNENFFTKTINISSMYFLAPFIEQNFKKNPYSGSRVIKTHNFQAHNGPFAPNENFFTKTTNIISVHLLAPCIVQDCKKNP